jgi:hypothetical protein
MFKTMFLTSMLLTLGVIYMLKRWRVVFLGTLTRSTRVCLLTREREENRSNVRRLTHIKL